MRVYVDTKNSELAFLWHKILGNKAYFDVNGNPEQLGWGLTSISSGNVQFINMIADNYWLDVKNEPGGNSFNLGDGYQIGSYYGMPNVNFNTMVLRTGRASVDVNAPPTFLLLLLLFMFLLNFRNKNKLIKNE